MEDEPDQGIMGFFKSLIKRKDHLGDSTDLAEELHDLMDQGQAKGLVSDEESHMVYSVLELKETFAHSIMIPRTEISSAPVNSTLADVIDLVKEHGHTRIPIYDDTIDRIVGLLHAKDLLKLWGEEPSKTIPLEILRKPYFVPEAKKLGELLRDLKERKTHLAIVTDEYGGTAGIITIEDILEEIVGEIMDEHDDDTSLLTVADDGSIVVDARLEFEKLEEHLGMLLPQGDFESVGGFIIHLLGRIPRQNEELTYGDLQIVITKADQRKIDKVRITRNDQSSPAGSTSPQP